MKTGATSEQDERWPVFCSAISERNCLTKNCAKLSLLTCGGTVADAVLLCLFALEEAGSVFLGETVLYLGTDKLVVTPLEHFPPLVAGSCC